MEVEKKLMIRCYSELILLNTFEERFRYLQLKGNVGKSTFGFDRVFNQIFYASQEWRQVRDRVIVRDYGCDLGIEFMDIPKGLIMVHHMNPIKITDIENRTDILLDPEFLITTHRLTTHNAIHYGDEKLLVKPHVERSRNDTCPWKH